MHGFADLSRLRILDALRDGERRVACLHGCGLVERDPRGREVFYALADGVGELLDGVDGLLERVGSSVACCELTTRSMGEQQG